MTVSNEMYHFVFRIMGKPYSIEVDKNTTTDEFIRSIAEKISEPEDKILLRLDLSLQIKGNAATRENAKEVDAQIQEQFKSNLVHFIQHSSHPIVIVRR